MVRGVGIVPTGPTASTSRQLTATGFAPASCKRHGILVICTCHVLFLIKYGLFSAVLFLLQCLNKVSDEAFPLCGINVQYLIKHRLLSTLCRYIEVAV